MRRGVVALVTVALFTVLGCVEKTSSYKTGDKSDRVAKYVLKAAPAAIEQRIDADFGGKVVLLGFDFKPKKVRPGEKVEVTWYWQVKQDPGPGWQLFTHVVDHTGKSRLNRDKDGPVRKNFQPEHWKQGMIIRDEQKITVPRDWKSDVVEFRIGFFKGSERLEVKGKWATKGNRVRGPVIAVDRPKPAPFALPRAQALPAIDGKIEGDAAWSAAASLGRFGDTITGKPVPAVTDVKVMWSEEKLFIAMKAVDDNVKNKFTKHDEEVWHEDAFEIFLDPLGDSKDYFELQVSPAGVVFDSYLPEYRKNHNDWTSDMEVKVAVDGTINKEADADKGWSAEIAIPWKALEKGGGIPPKAGDKWRMNFFRVNATKDKPVYSAWSPPKRGDFHALDRFRDVVFRDAPPAPSTPAAAAASTAEAKAAAPAEPKAQVQGAVAPRVGQ